MEQWNHDTIEDSHNNELKFVLRHCFAVPICMPPDGADYTGKVATVSGWGRLKYGGGVPSVLQEVEVSYTGENGKFDITYASINLTFMARYKIFEHS
jgi:hypothetical protein